MAPAPATGRRRRRTGTSRPAHSQPSRSTPPAAGSFTPVANPHSTMPVTRRPDSPTARPATNRPSMMPSLWVPPTMLSMINGFRTARASASPGSWPRRLASDGSASAMRTTPATAARRMAITDGFMRCPASATATAPMRSASGPYGDRVWRHAGCTASYGSESPSAAGELWFGSSPRAFSQHFGVV